MTSIPSHRALWIASVGMLGLSMGIIALTVALPIADGPARGTSSGEAVDLAASPGVHISREELERDARRPLRQPLLDDPAQAPAPMLAMPLPPLPPLVGIIVEPGKSVAVFQISATSISFKHVGDFVLDARIVAIDLTGMTVTRRGQTVFVRVSRGLAQTSKKGTGI